MVAPHSPQTCSYISFLGTFLTCFELCANWLCSFGLNSIVIFCFIFRSPHEKKKRRSHSHTKSKARSHSPSMSPGKQTIHKNSAHSASLSPVESRGSSQERSRQLYLLLVQSFVFCFIALQNRPRAVDKLKQ